ncbi:MAG: ParB-like nuclease domain-containing protein, partial [Akkermansia sp.]|nr:ParB-like nuclease domain-containing protein [Akkermansia sp.]
MDQFDMNTFGAPKTGEEKLRDYFYGELARGSEASKPTGGVEVRRDGTPHETPDYLCNTTEDGMLIFDAGGNASISSGYSGMMVGEDTTPSLDSVTSTPTDWTAGISRQMEAERKMRRTVAHLRSLVLFDKDFAFQSDLEINRPDLMWLADDSVRADRAGFNMLLGGELSRAISGGNTFGLLEQTLAAMPREEQLAAKGRMQQCDTESKAKELLGELWSGLIIKDYEAQKAELDKRNADRKAALDELKGVMSRDWLTAVMEGHGDIPWQLRHVANMERAGLKPETIENMRATHRRAKDAWGKLMQWMYGTSYTQAKANARAKGKELMREWDDTWHIFDRPSEADFYQQGAAELSESFDMSREQMAELLLTLTNDDGQLDEQAMALFLQALEKEAKSNQTVIYSKFWRNFGEAVADWARETGDWLGRNHLKSVSDFGSYIDESGQVHFVDEATRRRASAELAAHYSPQAEALKGYLTRFDDMRVEPSERRLDYMTDMLTKFGTTTGDSAPMMVANIAIPGVGGVIGGGALMFPALTNEAIARNYAMGATNPELLSVIEGGWEAASETMFSVYGGGLVSKGLRSLGADKLMGTAAIKTLGIKGIGKAVGAAWGNGFARYLGNVAFETFGEIVVEETVAETGTYATVQGLRALGVDLDDREWAPFKSTLQILDDPGQTGAMIAYCAVLGLLGVPGNMRAARQFAADRRMLLQVGLTEEGIAEVQQELRKSEAQVSKVLADAQTQKRLAELRAAAEAKAVEEAEAEAGRPLAEEEVAEAKKKAGDKAVAEEAERIITEAQKPLTEKMRAVYLRDVQNHDPVALKKRMEERGKKFLEDVETQLYAESGVMEHTLRRTGIVVGERTPEGLYKVNLPGAKEGETHEVEWTDEQLMAYVAMQRGSDVVKSMRQLQARVAGEALAEADKSLHGEMVDLSVLPVKALARMERNGGRVDYAVLKDLAEDAREKIAGFVAGGMSWTEARGQLSEIPGVTLGTLVNTAEGFVKRVDEAFATGEAQELGLKKPEDAATNVFRVNKAGSAGQSVLLYNRGLMNEREFVEDHIERDVVAAVEGENATTSWEALEAMLKRVDGEMVKNGGKRIFKKGATGRASVIEAFSKLAQSYFLLNHGKYDMSGEAHATIEYVHKQLADAQYLMTLSHAWNAFAQSKAGKEYMQKEGASLEKLLSDAGASVAGKYAAAKFDAAAAAVVLEAYEGSRRPSPEAAKPVLEQYEQEMEELDHPEAEGEPVVVEAQESITGEQLVLEDEPMVDEVTGEFEAPPGAEVQQDADMKGRGLVDGKYVLMEGGSVYGVAEVDSIELSEDVPQFKKKDSAAGRVEADADGTTHELAGGWNVNSAPIHVWRRVDGRLEVISGRHRLAHAKKNGVKHIAVRVYDEAEELDAAWAKLHDVEQNILDNTCNAIDVAYYFRHNPMTLGEAEARGLMPKTKQGEQTAASRIGLYVAANASEETFAMMVNGRCTAEDAYMACIVASSAEGQQLALETRAGTKGKKNSWEYVTALVRGAEQMQPADAGMLDLFGNDTAFREQSEKIARYVAAVRAGLKSQLNVLQSAGRLNKKGAVSKSLGVSVKTPKDMSRLIERLALLDAAYERLDYELGIPAKVDAWDGKSAVPTKLDELDPGKLYVAKDVANGDVSYSIIGPKAQTWDKYADRAFRGRDDGKLKAEIDASLAKVKAEALRGNGSEALKKVVANVDAETRAMAQRWRELDREVLESEDEAVHLAYFEADDALNANMHETLAQSGADVGLLRKYDGRSALIIKAMYAESVAEGVVSEELAEMVDALSVKKSVFTMEEVLDYKELYEAYPWLAKVQLHIMDVGTEVGGYTDGRSIVLAPYWVYNPENLRSALLHELQHMVQFAEGFTTGDMPAVMVATLQEEL